ncbi:MAG: hypothetical protein IPN66_08435 [Candidatus Competibacteraceae bacterium]|nr:hypothetical protein [Candidatus Competibacteraceae bacterium]
MSAASPTRSLVDLARQVPVLLLNPDSHRLLEDGSQPRRRFMDWGYSVAEPAFLDAWRRLRRGPAPPQCRLAQLVVLTAWEMLGTAN